MSGCVTPYFGGSAAVAPVVLTWLAHEEPALTFFKQSSHIIQESRAVAGKPRDAAVNFY